MRDLALRLAALDADAGAALQVIAYFDRLVESHAGLSSIIRGAAVLAGAPVRLDDDVRHLRIRVEPSGVPVPAPSPPDPAWPHCAIDSATLWLERGGPGGPVDAMVLERAAAAARAVLDRTRGPGFADPASVELVVDASADPSVRRQAARRLGFDTDAAVRAVAYPDGRAAVVGAAAKPGGERAGIGPVTSVDELPRSYAAARTALRFAADGTDDDPGPTVVHHDDLGALVLLADAAGGDLPDVRALEHAPPGMLGTLQAVADAASLRAAAVTLRLHHSTLQDRIAHAEHVLGWNVREPSGRLRLQLALTLRRLRRHA